MFCHNNNNRKHFHFAKWLNIVYMFSSVYTYVESLGGGQRTQVTSSFHPAAQTDGPKCPTRLSLRS